MRKIIFALGLLGTLSPANAANSCSDRHIVASYIQYYRSLGLTVEDTPSSLIIRWGEMGDRDAFFASGTVNTLGMLALDMQLKAGPSGQRDPRLRGRELFDLFLQKFGERVRFIQGDWTVGDNLNAFNKMTEAQKEIAFEEAARSTWTGQQSQRHGFTNVSFITADGDRGHFNNVQVLFSNEPNDGWPKKLRRPKTLNFVPAGFSEVSRPQKYVQKSYRPSEEADTSIQNPERDRQDWTGLDSSQPVRIFMPDHGLLLF